MTNKLHRLNVSFFQNHSTAKIKIIVNLLNSQSEILSMISNHVHNLPAFYFLLHILILYLLPY